MRILWPWIGFILFVTKASAQYSPTSIVWPTSIDSILLVVEHNLTQEMTYKGQAEIHEEIGRIILNPKTQSRLLKKLKQTSSYETGVALLDHSNVFFTFFCSESSSLRIEISTLSRNIDIQSIHGSSYKGRISQKFGKYLLKTMIHFGFYKKMKAIGDLEGLE